MNKCVKYLNGCPERVHILCQEHNSIEHLEVIKLTKEDLNIEFDVKIKPGESISWIQSTEEYYEGLISEGLSHATAMLKAQEYYADLKNSLRNISL